MIDLYDPSSLNFKCEYCNQPFSHYTVNIAVLLYGVAFLSRNYSEPEGYNKGYACLTCPSCVKTMLLKCDNLALLYYSIWNVAASDGLNDKTELTYSFLSLFHGESRIEILDRFEYLEDTFANKDQEEPPPSFTDLLSAFEEDNELWGTDFLRSYFSFGASSDAFASVLWFKPNDIEKIMEAENTKKVQLIPRYYYRGAWLKNINNFCWEHYLFKKNFDSNAPKYIKERTFVPYGEESNPEPKFLRILLDDPTPLRISNHDVNKHYESLWKTKLPFKDESIPTDPSDLNPDDFDNSEQESIRLQYVRKINRFSDEPFVHHFLNDNYQNFIKDYIALVQQKDFAYADFWQLKFQYLERLNGAVNTGRMMHYKYAFFKTGDVWILKYEGESLLLQDHKGLKYIHCLIANKGKKINTFELSDLDGKETESDALDNLVDLPDDSKSDGEDDESYDENNSSEAAALHGEFKRYAQHDKSSVSTKGKEIVLSGFMGDQEFLKTCKEKLLKLEEDIQIAEKNEDKKELFKLKSEKKTTLKEIFKVYDPKAFYLHLKGKLEKLTPRSFRPDDIKVRNSVVMAIRRELKEILGDRKSDNKKLREKIWRHFDQAFEKISKYENTYSPKEEIDWFLG